MIRGMPLDFSAVTAPFRMQPGLRRLPPGTPQLGALPPESPAFTEKLAVLARHPDQALAARPGFDPLPALRAIAAQAALDGAGAIGWDGTVLRSRLLGLRATLPNGDLQADAGHHAEAAAALQALPPRWRPAGLLCLAVAPDLAVVDGASGTIPWIAACLPSHWDPQAKVGRHFTEVHAPVADNATLLAAGTHLMRLVCEPQRWERFVWTVTPYATHDQHPLRRLPRSWPDGADADALAAQAWLRSERQTFIPLPPLGQAVFTIEVDVQPLAGALSRAADAQRLHDALATMSDAVLAYRGLAPARGRLLQWLAAQAAQLP
jgi:hypothetical protein